MTGTRAVFIDRDGVLNELVEDPETGMPESPLRPADVCLSPGAASALVRLRAAGWRLVGVSNQPAAAKGKISLDQLLAVHEQVLALLAAEGAVFDDFRLCLHHPAGVIPELTGPCACRKPAPGMLLDAARELHLELARSWMIGDTDSDIAAGQEAGCHTILIEQPRSGHKRRGARVPDAVVPDLQSACTRLLGEERVH